MFGAVGVGMGEEVIEFGFEHDDLDRAGSRDGDLNGGLGGGRSHSDGSGSNGSGVGIGCSGLSAVGNTEDGRDTYVREGQQGPSSRLHQPRVLVSQSTLRIIRIPHTPYI